MGFRKTSKKKDIPRVIDGALLPILIFSHWGKKDFPKAFNLLLKRKVVFIKRYSTRRKVRNFFTTRMGWLKPF